MFLHGMEYKAETIIVLVSKAPPCTSLTVILPIKGNKENTNSYWFEFLDLQQVRKYVCIMNMHLYLSLQTFIHVRLE